jgi:hypothetical protein
MANTPRPKRHTLYFLDVYDGRTGERLGQLVDISQQGVSVLSDTPLKSTSTFSLRILVPRTGGPDERLEFEAESRWTTPDPQSGSHTSGFLIHFLTDAQRDLIERLVNEFGYSKIGDVNLAVPRPPAGTPATKQPSSLKHFLANLFSH